MKGYFFYNYCYKCDKETAYSDLKKNGQFTMEHCTVCGIYQDFNLELKDRYYKELMGV